MKDAPPVSPWLVLSVGVFAISTGAIFARMASAPALVIAAYRVGLATLFLLPFTAAKTWREVKILPRHDILFVLASGFFLALHFASWISSLFYTSVASSVVIVNTIPLWTGILSPFLTGDPFTTRLKRGLLLALPGGIIIGWGDFALGGGALWGDFLALLGSFFAAIYILFGRKVRPHLPRQLHYPELRHCRGGSVGRHPRSRPFSGGIFPKHLGGILPPRSRPSDPGALKLQLGAPVDFRGDGRSLPSGGTHRQFPARRRLSRRASHDE